MSSRDMFLSNKLARLDRSFNGFEWPVNWFRWTPPWEWIHLWRQMIDKMYTVLIRDYYFNTRFRHKHMTRRTTEITSIQRRSPREITVNLNCFLVTFFEFQRCLKVCIWILFRKLCVQDKQFAKLFQGSIFPLLFHLSTLLTFEFRDKCILWHNTLNPRVWRSKCLCLCLESWKGWYHGIISRLRDKNRGVEWFRKQRTYNTRKWSRDCTGRGQHNGSISHTIMIMSIMRGSNRPLILSFDGTDP